jgi:hypothetical protein
MLSRFTMWDTPFTVPFTFVIRTTVPTAMMLILISLDHAGRTGVRALHCRLYSGS